MCGWGQARPRGHRWYLNTHTGWQTHTGWHNMYKATRLWWICLIGTTKFDDILLACKCLNCAYLNHWWSIINFFVRGCVALGSVSRNIVPWAVFPNTAPGSRECIRLPLWNPIHPDSRQCMAILTSNPKDVSLYTCWYWHCVKINTSMVIFLSKLVCSWKVDKTYLPKKGVEDCT